MILIIVQPIFWFKLQLVKLSVAGTISTYGKRDVIYTKAIFIQCYFKSTQGRIGTIFLPGSCMRSTPFSFAVPQTNPIFFSGYTITLSPSRNCSPCVPARRDVFLFRTRVGFSYSIRFPRMLSFSSFGISRRMQLSRRFESFRPSFRVFRQYKTRSFRLLRRAPADRAALVGSINSLFPEEDLSITLPPILNFAIFSFAASVSANVFQRFLTLSNSSIVSVQIMFSSFLLKKPVSQEYKNHAYPPYYRCDTAWFSDCTYEKGMTVPSCPFLSVLTTFKVDMPAMKPTYGQTYSLL